MKYRIKLNKNMIVCFAGVPRVRYGLVCFKVPNISTFIYLCIFAQKLSTLSHLCHGIHKPCLKILLRKMADILQTTFSGILSGMEVFVFWLELTDVYHQRLKKWLRT